MGMYNNTICKTYCDSKILREFTKKYNETACHKCPIGAVCFGGDHIQNLQGYWRFNGTEGVCKGATQYDGCSFTQCRNSASCLGADQSVNSYSVSKEQGNNDTLVFRLAPTLSDEDAGDIILAVNSTVVAGGVTVRIQNIITQDSGHTEYLIKADETIEDVNDIFLYQEKTEECEVGYIGNLCNKCARGFNRTGKTECTPCPVNLWITYVVMFAGLFVAAGIAVVLIRMTINGSKKKKARMSIMMKIFTSYLQLVSLASSFKLNWPETVLEMFAVQETISSPGDQLISIECVMDKHANGDDIISSLDMYYKKLLFFLLLPIFAAIVPCIFWSWRYFVHRARHLRSWTWKRLKIPDENDGKVQVEQLKSIIEAAGEEPTDILLVETTRFAHLDQGPQPLHVVKMAFIRAKRSEMWDKTILSVIVLIFLLHPNVTKQIFLMFTCMPLRVEPGVAEGSTVTVNYLTSALDINCSSDTHMRAMYLVVRFPIAPFSITHLFYIGDPSPLVVYDWYSSLWLCGFIQTTQ